MESATNAKNRFCHDCGKEIKIEGEKIKNGVFLKYRQGEEEINIVKCNQCYKKNPSLEKFRKCEIYSRIVGYLRPVDQWNYGKRKEFEERKEFKIK